MSVTKTIEWSGHVWKVRNTIGTLTSGPGPNHFSHDNVWVDSSGYLHLKINNDGKWFCASITNLKSLGYGKYQFNLGSDVASIDPNVVIGLFTYAVDPAFYHREIDIEFSRWSDPTRKNLQWLIQPLTSKKIQFEWPQGFKYSRHSLNWQAKSVNFEAAQGSAVLHKGVLTAGVPPSGGEKIGINLWLYRGRAPQNKQGVEVVLRRFSYQ